jgi:CheY-like chemotaxis protein
MGTGIAVKRIEVILPQDELVRVLVIDDEETFQGQMKDFFESLNCAVDTATSPEEARNLLARNAYEIVIADVNFDTSRIKGDRFVLDNERRLGRARVVVVTGQGQDTITKYHQLRKKGIDIFDKSDDTLDQSLEAIAQQKLEERENAFLNSVKQTISSSLGQNAADAAAVKMAVVPSPDVNLTAQLQEELKQILVQWLESRSERNVPVLAFASRILTANEMIDEIQSNSEIGLAHVRMLVSEIRNCLGLLEDPYE